MPLSTLSTRIAAFLPQGKSMCAGSTADDLLRKQALPLSLCCIIVTLFFVANPMDLPELFVGTAGALAYSLVKAQDTPIKKKKISKAASGPVKVPPKDARPRKHDEAEPKFAPRQRQPSTKAASPVYRQASVVPVVQPQFKSVGWEAEVQELLGQIRPTRENHRVIENITDTVRNVLRRLIPEADVFGVAAGNFQGKKAFGVAVPEVDIVVTVSPDVIVERLRNRLPNGAYLAKLDAKKLQKSAIRACTDQLVAAGGFKFRRSAFRGDEPKFTLLAPCSVTGADETIAIDFAVNTATPLRSAALFKECGQLDSRARDVILLLRRWARDRGISHAARGHMPPYAWTLLAIYFLQVCVDDEGEPAAILPSLKDSAALQGRGGKMGATSAKVGEAAPDERSTCNTSSAELFKRCLAFYSAFDWRKEAVSVRAGRRGAPTLSLPLHITLGSDGKPLVAPSIEDPFMPDRNIAHHMTAEGVMRLHEELARASKLCEGNKPLSELLELWAPPEHDAAHPEHAAGIPK